MKRREFVKLIGAATALPLAVQAQQQSKPKPVIGLVQASIKLSARLLKNLREGLAEYGYIDGENYRLDIREIGFQNERVPIMYREFVDEKVALILCISTFGVENARATTQSIPIVFTIGSDPVANGFVASLNKPGGNITGVYNLGVMLAGKRLEVLHELLPSVKKIAFLTDPTNTALGKLQKEAIETAAKPLGINLVYVSAHTPDEFDAAFEAATHEGSGGMVIGADANFAGGLAEPLMAVAARHRLPTIYVDDLPVKAGGLISYASDQDEPQRIVGRYAARILKGEKPADMPVQLSTRTALIINLKTAKQLGVTVPNTLLARADELIE
jgi:putative ABC transport system substrate-binding protein